MLCPTRPAASGELGARAHAELAIRARQVRLDRALGHEQLAGDLAVRAAVGCELSDPPLRLSQLVAVARSAAAEPCDLRPRALRPQRRAELLEQRERRLQRRARLGTPLCTPLHAPEREQGARAVERLREVLVRLECIVEVASARSGRLGCRDQPAAAQRRGDRPRLTKPRPRASRSACTSRARSRSPTRTSASARSGAMQNIAGSRRRSRSSIAGRWREVADRRVRVAERQREEAEHVRAAGREREITHARRLSAAPSRRARAPIHAAEVGVDERARPVPGCLRVPEIGAERCVERPARPVIGELPAPGADLELGEEHEGEALVVEATARVARARARRAAAGAPRRESPFTYSCIPSISSGVSSRLRPAPSRSSGPRAQRSRWTPSPAQ